MPLFRDQVDKFSVPLRVDSRNLVELKAKSVTETTTVGNVRQHVSSTRLGFLTHLIERGLHSGHAYMATGGNHRDLQMKIWLTREADKPCTMIQSCVNPKEDSSCKFDISSNICMFMHSVLTVKDTDVDTMKVPFRSPCPLTTVDPNSTDGSEKTSFSFASGRYMGMMTGKAFKRLCLFFGFNWVDDAGIQHDDEDDVKPGDIMSFCDKMSDYDMATLDGFKKFYQDQHMDEVFEWDEPCDSMDITEIHRNFGELYRSYVPVRLNIYDGQHRMLLMAYFLTGHFDPSTKMPLTSCAWSASKYRASDYSKTQMFAKLSYHLGSVFNGKEKVTSPSLVVSELRLAGEQITQGNANAIKVNWTEFFQKVNSALQTSCSTVQLSHANYWSRTVSAKSFEIVEANGIALFNAIESVVLGNVRYLELFKNREEVAKNWTELKEPVLNGLKSINEMTNVQKLGIYSKVMLQLFRCSLDRFACRANFVRLFELPSFPWNQRSDVKKHLGYLTSESWFRRYVFNVVEKVVLHMNIRTYLERHLIQRVKSASDTLSEWKNGLKNDCKWNLEVLRNQDKDFTWPSKEKLESAKSLAAVRQMLSLPSKGGSIHHRMSYGFWCGLVNDIVESILQYGFDPDFAVRPASTRNFDKTQQGLKKVFDDEWKIARKSVISELKLNGFTEEEEDKDGDFLITAGMLMRKPLADADGSDDEADEEDKEASGTRRRKKKGKKYNIFFDVVAHLHTKYENEPAKLQDILRFTKNNRIREYLT